MAGLAGTAKDAGGRALGADVTWRFTVEEAPVKAMWLAARKQARIMRKQATGGHHGMGSSGSR
jgi:hypothetical protein